jgi:endonuclease/exonuclease/phosphatase family metal-dependent hydrolase
MSPKATVNTQMPHPKLPFFILILLCLALSSCTFVPDYYNFIDQDGPRYAQLNLAPKISDIPNIMKVVSYNIALGENFDLVEEILKNNSNLANADIVCLQEMSRQGTEHLAKSLNYNYIYYPSAIHPGSNKDFGQAILTKWEIKEDKKVLLPFNENDKYIKLNRAAVKAVVLIGQKQVWVFSTHLGVVISPQQRQAQARAILNSMPDTTQYCIIAGDFNTYAYAHNKAILKTFGDAGFSAPTKNCGWTYKYWYLLNRKATLDYIFTKGMTIKNAGKVMDRRPSDHFPIWAELEFPN